MRLARANTTTRNKSRSPLPQSPRPQTFLPPSHYAEAGGLSPRPRDPNDSQASNSDSGTYSDYYNPLDERRSSAFMPISSNSDSSFEFRETPKPVEHNRFSVAHGSKTPRNSSKRESHMKNLPLVEAQLLPSLRDTIHRMTQPPSRPAASRALPEYDMDETESLSYVPTSSQISGVSSDSQNILQPLTNKPLKSSLRVPTPKLQSNSPSTTPRLEQSVGYATSSSSSVSKNRSDMPSTSSKQTRTRERSRTDPGAAPQEPSSFNAPSTPVLKADTRPRKGSTSSNIPRPRAATGLRSASSTPRPQFSEVAPTDSSSDLESRYEQDARNRRSLRVVNGILSSESESSDGESRRGIGLGLGLVAPHASRSVGHKSRSRFAQGNTNEAYPVQDAERRRNELLGLVHGLERLDTELREEIPGQSEGSHDNGSDHGVVISNSGRVDFGLATSQTPPRVLISSSSTRDDGLDSASLRRKDRHTSLWQRSRSLSPAPPQPPQDHPTTDKRERKSVSRSPMIKQPLTPKAEEKTNSLPRAARRHSVYQPRPPSPISSPPEPDPRYAAEECSLLSQSPESLYDEPDNGAWAEDHQRPEPPTSYLQSHDHLHPQSQAHSNDLVGAENVMLTLQSRMAAARERAVLGIPPSVSDVGYPNLSQGQGERMSYMDSGSSLARVGKSQWEEVGGDRGARVLSFGAEKLFRTLSGRGRSADQTRKRERRSGNAPYTVDQDDLNASRITITEPTSTALSQSSSAPSMYEIETPDEPEPPAETWPAHDFAPEVELEDERHADSPAVDDAWRSFISPTTYTAILERRGAREIQRQEAIHDLYVSEESFVCRLSNTIKLFILPLRMQDSKRYIAGVPVEISKLFDWVEDILNLHIHLLSTLRQLRETQGPVVERIAEGVRSSFVKQLEVYQPYLAQLVNIAGMIARLVTDPASDFGEFVRIQQSSSECSGWTLENLLVDPVTRLGRYPTMFRTLHDYTPKSHVDYVPTLALVHSTELIIKVMTEVKIREDEYDLVKSLSRRIQGLPPSVSLAKRGRRLLCQGQLQCLPAALRVDVKDSGGLDNSDHTKPTFSPRRSSNLVDAVHEWDRRRERSGSTATASTAESSYSKPSFAVSDSPRTPTSPHFSSRMSYFSPKTNLSRPSRLTTLQGLSQTRETARRSEEPLMVQTLVFTDCIVLARISGSQAEEEWTLMDNIGISKLLGVTEVSDESSGGSTLLELDLLPTDIKSLDGNAVNLDHTTVDVLPLRVLPPASSSSSSENELHKTWLSAFQQSSRLTLRSLSIPGGSYQQDIWDDPTSQRSLPKSPSLIDSRGNSQNQERQERSWWSSCFRQVLRELQSRDAS
ncbi:DH domain-containing protein [Favolaschia claudopus]|uniref:DH domain-containing protein n=1 Tax=Favolaschia claudopus TaxID=2862362 RepID=A0AAW0BND3_9AGAR